MSAVWTLIYYVLLLFLLLLFARLVMEYVFMFARSWRPSGPVVLLLEVVYTATDPPLRALRKIIPPLRLGGFSLDMSFLVLSVVVLILMNVAQDLATT